MGKEQRSATKEQKTDALPESAHCVIASTRMPRGLVLVIEDDEWVSTLLANSIREAGYEVSVCTTAGAGFAAAVAQRPDCIICDIDLPDNDGYSVARGVRTHPSRVSVTPFLFLSGLDDEQSRLEGFHVGADVYMTKPFRIDEVVAQIEALVHMAARLRERRDSLLSSPPEGTTGSAIEGDIGQMSIATVLTVLEMERRTGIFEVTSKKRRAQLDIARGCVVEGTVGGTRESALSALRTMLAWNVGRFSFTPSLHREPPPFGMKLLGALLIEAMRLTDEEARAELERPGRKRPNESKRPAPSLGGPASSPADFAPPSSRRPEFVRTASPSPWGEPELADWEISDDSAPGPRTPRSLKAGIKGAVHPYLAPPIPIANGRPAVTHTPTPRPPPPPQIRRPNELPLSPPELKAVVPAAPTPASPRPPPRPDPAARKR